MSYRNCFENNCPVTINSMFNECSAVHLHSNALQVIRVRGAAAPRVFNSNYLFYALHCIYSSGGAGRTGERVLQKYITNHMNVSVMLVCSSVQLQLVVLCGADLMIHYQM